MTASSHARKQFDNIVFLAGLHHLNSLAKNATKDPTFEYPNASRKLNKIIAEAYQATKESIQDDTVFEETFSVCFKRQLIKRAKSNAPSLFMLIRNTISTLDGLIAVACVSAILGAITLFSQSLISCSILTITVFLSGVIGKTAIESTVEKTKHLKDEIEKKLACHVLNTLKND